jgi:hypothetical protein
MSEVLDAPKARAKVVRRMTKPPTLEDILGPQWRSLEWRLDNLYWIVDEHGTETRFCMNEEQRDFVRNLHTRNLILKARQLGFSTLLEILELDQGLFNANHNGVVISDTLPNANKLFGKIEFALKRIPEALKLALPIKNSAAKTSIEWEHGSTIYVSTSSRGGTVQFLHVSELGRIARKWPERAAEIVSGAFESVSADNIIVVESTAEGAAGAFYDLCMPALRRMREGAAETRLDWRLHFYPWYRKAAYSLTDEECDAVVVGESKHKYFDQLEVELVDKRIEAPGFKIKRGQRAWYVKKEETQGRKMKREYPSTPEEAFEQAVEGAVFGEEMTKVRELKRITIVPADPEYAVSTYWDFGTGDTMAVWFKQRVGLQNRWIGFMKGDGSGLGAFWRKVAAWCEDRHLRMGKHFLPHDADAEILGESIETKKLILERAGMRNIVVVPRIAQKSTAIDLARTALPADNWFDREACAEGIKCLDGYQFAWNEKMGVWSAEPLHNWASHGADAWMQYAQTGNHEDDEEDAAKSIGAFLNRKSSWR